MIAAIERVLGRHTELPDPFADRSIEAESIRQRMFEQFGLGRKDIYQLSGKPEQNEVTDTYALAIEDRLQVNRDKLPEDLQADLEYVGYVVSAFGMHGF